MFSDLIDNFFGNEMQTKCFKIKWFLYILTLISLFFIPPSKDGSLILNETSKLCYILTLLHFKYTQKILARWLEQRARNLELTEKVVNSYEYFIFLCKYITF